MEQQSDTPRTDAAIHVMKFVGCPDFEYVDVIVARNLERELAAVTRERDEARALNARWAEKAAAWFASPEAAQRLQSYRDLAQQVAEAQNERDEARAEVAKLRVERDTLKAAAKKAEAALADIGDSDHEPTDDLAWCEQRAQEALPVVRFALAATEAP